MFDGAKILAVDDEALALKELVRNIKKVLPEANVDSFSKPEQALEAAESVKYDIAFTDIQMPRMQGVQLAKALKKTNPLINIIFVTGYSEYKGEAIRLHASGYIEKPVSADDIKDELDNLLHPFEPAPGKIYAQTFGNFCLFVNGEPVHFRRDRGEELLAYLIDRKGAAISRKEAGSILFEDGDFSRSEQVYLSKIAGDLEKDLKEAGAPGLFVQKHGSYYVDTTKFSCDSYDYLSGDLDAINHFTGEYMEQYSWAEYLKDKFYE